MYRNIKAMVLRYLRHQPFPLAMLRPMEAERYLQYQKQWKQPILDIDCGDGFFAKSVFGTRKIAVGVDVSKKILGGAKRSGAYKKIMLFDGIVLPFPTKQAKTVIANCVLEHVDCPELLLKEISRVTATDGLFMFTVPTTNFEQMLLEFQLFKRLKWDAAATPTAPN